MVTMSALLQDTWLVWSLLASAGVGLAALPWRRAEAEANLAAWGRWVAAVRNLRRAEAPTLPEGVWSPSEVTVG